MKNKITVYGSSGFIGSHFCEMYPDEVVKVSVQGHGELANVTDKILYLISTTDNYNIMTDPYIDIETNLKVLMDVLWQYKDKPQTEFNFVSSWFVYGDTELPAREDSCCKPRGFYSITKKCAEDLLISFCKTYNLRYRILRLANVIGVGDKGVSHKKNALQYLIEKLADNEPIGLYHNGDFYRNYIHVEDACRALMYGVKILPGNEIINVSDKRYRFRDLIDYAKGKLDSHSYIESIEPSSFHKIVQVNDMYMDGTQLRRYGFDFKYTAFDAINEVIDEIKKEKELRENNLQYNKAP